jgi:hypothetical protein
VQVITNTVAQSGTWPQIWSPPPTWPGIDLFPTDPAQGTWDDSDTSGPWGTSPPPAGQGVRLSKRFVDANTGAAITNLPVSATDGTNTVSGNTSGSGSSVPGRIPFRVRQGGTYTLSWQAFGNYAAGSENVTVQANGGGVHVKTNQLTPTGGAQCRIVVLVRKGGAPVSGATVTVKLMSDGSQVGSGSTGADGTATITGLDCSKAVSATAKDPDTGSTAGVGNVTPWSDPGHGPVVITLPYTPPP